MESDYDPGIKQSMYIDESFRKRFSDGKGVNTFYIDESPPPFIKNMDTSFTKSSSSEKFKELTKRIFEGKKVSIPGPAIEVKTDGLHAFVESVCGDYTFSYDCCGSCHKLIYKGDKEKMPYKKDENSGLDYMPYVPYKKEPLNSLDYAKGYSDGYSKGYYQARSLALSNFTTTRVKRIIYNNPATIVFWADGTKTVVKCAKGEKFNKYHGFCAALAKHIYENNSRVNALVNSGIDDNPEKTKSKGSSKKK